MVAGSNPVVHPNRFNSLWPTVQEAICSPGCTRSPMHPLPLALTDEMALALTAEPVKMLAVGPVGPSLPL